MQGRSMAPLRAIAIVIALQAAAGAQEPEPVRPWARGVAADEQEQALALFREGNVLFEQSRYSQALERYRAAIAHWDHPAIRFNMAVCLVNLDLPLDANESLDKALAYGADAFETRELYAQALTYRKLLDGRLARLTLRCAEPNARVTLDGKDVLRGSGESRHVLLPGRHQLVASKDGFVTSTQTITLLSGEERREDVQLTSVAAATRYEHRWAIWKPWLVFGGGAAVVLIGLALELSAKADYDSYAAAFGAAFADGCGKGCTIPSSLAALETRARAENGAAIASFAVGGAGLAAGIVLLIVNRARPVLRTNASLRARLAPAPGGLAITW